MAGISQHYTYVELEVVQEHAADLTSVIATNPTLFGQHLVQSGLAVQTTVTSIVSTLGFNDYQKGSNLLSLVDSKLRTAGTKENVRKYFNDFLMIIAYPMGHRDLAELLVATLKFKSKDPSYTSPLQESHVPSISSPGNQQPSPTSAAMTRSNEDRIRALFTALVLSVQAAIKASNDVEVVRQYFITFFGCDFPETTELRKLFEAVSSQNLWNYQHHSPLESVANHFLSGNQEIEKSIKAYKACLSGFYVTTGLVDYIESKKLTVDDDDESDDHKPPVLSSKQYRRLKVVLKVERKITELSLEYVHKLWCSFAEEYDIPSLTVVLERVASGSLEITWIIPAYLADKIVPRSKFFRKHGIVKVSLDDTVIYNEDEMTDYEVSFLELFDNFATADIELLCFFLKKGVDPNIFDKFGATPLVIACWKGQLKVATVLVLNGAVVNYESKQGATPLAYASRFGHTELVDLLLSRGADINKGDRVPPLHGASNGGHVDIARLLVNHGAKIDGRDQSKTGATPLIVACGENHLEVVSFLIENGADVNLQTKNRGSTPLHTASQKGHPAVVKLLLKSGAQLEIKNKEGRTPLMLASWKGHLETVIELLRGGAEVNTQDQEGLTALILATQNRHLKVVEALLDAEADTDITESTAGWSALFFAAKSGYLEIVQQLLSQGANVDIEDINGLFPDEVTNRQDIREEIKRHSLSQSETEASESRPQETEDNTDATPDESEGESPDPDKTGRREDTGDHKTIEVDIQDQPKVIEEKKRRDLVKESYQRLLKIFDVLEDSLLPSRREKKLHQQRKEMHSNIYEANQELAFND